jgi:glycosyltransferase involved in cell wall biosynthesis
LAVATLNKRKNTENIVKAFSLISKDYPDLKLVLVGDSNRITASMDLDVSNPNIIFTGYIEDEALPTLYKNALAFVFPSLYEGFGIPILEAQASETPVIATDIPIFREVAEDSVLYCTPEAESIAEKMKEIEANPTLRENLIAKGLKNIEKFGPETITRQIKEIFQEG